MIRPATPADVTAIARLIRALADYERLADRVQLDESRLADHLFGGRPCVEALIAEHSGAAVGFALYFTNYSTFLTRPGIYLEDLFVEPEHRRGGFGKALLRALAGVAVARGCGRLEWSVLNWNEPAIRFYEALGAEAMTGWTVNRLEGAALDRLAGA